MKGLTLTTNFEEIQLCAGIHTMECTLNGVEAGWAAEVPGVGNLGYANNRVHINLNKFVRETGRYAEHYISTFSEFTTIFAELMQETGASGYSIHRVDFRIDSYTNGWREMLKWNYALMYAMRAHCGWRESVHRWDMIGTTVETFERSRRAGSSFCCYDRAARAGNTAPTRMRYEIRLKLDEPLQDVNGLAVIGHEWACRIASCAEHFSQIPEAATQDVLNDIRMKAAEAEANGLPVEKKRLFLGERERIFTSAQAVEIGAALDMGKTTVYKYAQCGERKLSGEYFTAQMLRDYADKAAAALGAFISG